MILLVSHSCVHGAMVRMVGGHYEARGDECADDDDGGITWPSMPRFSVDKLARAEAVVYGHSFMCM